jgi:hypothetical protein
MRFRGICTQANFIVEADDNDDDAGVGGTDDDCSGDDE